MTTRSKKAAILSLLACTSLVLGACSEKSDKASPSTDGSAKTDGLKLSGTKGKLTAEGATSQQKAMEYFRTAYGAAIPGASFDYTATGSGSGQKQFIGGVVDFGGSDSPLSDAQAEKAKARCGGNEAWHLPLVIGPVAIAYKLKGVDKLDLSPDVIAQIFSGKIKKWNDPAIEKLNKNAKLPDADIKVLYRSEESGTSDNFQKFLKAAAPSYWTTTGKSFPTATGSGANGSKGVITEVAATEGSITYVEAGFAKDVDGVHVASLDFGDGPVELNSDNVGVALDHLKYKGKGHNMIVDANALFSMKEKNAYPLVLTTYEIVCSKGYKKDTANMVKDFLKVALANQNSTLADKGYIPVKGAYKKKLEEAVDAIQP